MTNNSLGFKNNNYGNIRYNSKINWQGQTGQDKGFVTFDTPENGIRAVMSILNTYMKGGVNTIEAILNKYAPPIENDTASYIAQVAKEVGINPTAKVSPTKPVLQSLSKAIAKREIGYVVPQNILDEAFNTLGRATYAQKAALGGVAIVLIAALVIFVLYKKGVLSA